MLNLHKPLALFALFCLPLSAYAGKNAIDHLNFSSQDQFKQFSQDLTGALAYKTLRPAEPLGLVGFDVGASINVSQLKNKQMGAVSSNAGSSIDAISLHAVKGLPLGIDLGVDYTSVPGSNIETWGGNLSWAFIEGGTATPAIGLTGHYTQTSGLDALDYKSYGLDVGISKGILNMTPFASIGMINSEIKPLVNNQTAGVLLQKVNTTSTKLAAGVNINLLFMDVMVAYNQIGDVGTYSLKAGYRF